VEWFGFIELVSVGRPNNVRVLVLLSSPAGAIPQLAVAFIAGHQVVRFNLERQKIGSIELLRCLPGSEVWLVVNLRLFVAEPERSGRVV
jgi:hypothetical protein